MVGGDVEESVASVEGAACVGAVAGAETAALVEEVVTVDVACGSWITVEDRMVGAGAPGEPRLVGGGSSVGGVAGEVDWRGGVGEGLAARGPGGRAEEVVGSCIAIA